MQTKRSLKIRLMTIYVVYFVALIAGFAYNVMPALRHGANMGQNVSTEMMDGWFNGNHRLSKIFIGIPTLEPKEYASQELGDDRQTTVTAYASKFDIIVSQEADEGQPLTQAVMNVVGGSSMVYLLSLVLMVIYIAVFVFIFLIIHSLRKSVSSDSPLENRCTWYTRIIGILILAATIGDAVGQWYMNRQAADILAGTDLVVNTAFTLNYWNVLIAILVIFTAEVFAIGSKLGEEQKLTI